jgi:dipeptidyl aminopeptidase/acylaminoacyl peptidase
MYNARSGFAELVSVFLWLGLGSSALSDERPRPIPVESALDTRSFGELSPLVLSPDGKWLAYLLRSNARTPAKLSHEMEREHYVRTGEYLRNEASDIWISNTETHESRNITGGIGANWAPSWSPDGRYLGFLSDRDGSGQARLWMWDSNENRLFEVTRLNVRSPYPAPGIQWIRDSRTVLITVTPQQLSFPEYVSKVMSSVSVHTPNVNNATGATVSIYDGPAARSGDIGPIRSSRGNLDAYSLSDLVMVEVNTGNVTSIANGSRIGWYSSSPDGSRIAYTVPLRLDPEGRFRKRFELSMFALSDKRHRVVVSDALLTDTFTWSPDSSLLLYGVHEGGGTTFFTVGALEGTPRVIAKVPSSVGWYETAIWSRAGNAAFVIVGGALWRVSVSTGKADELARIENRQIVRKISDPSGVLWSDDGGKTTIVLARDEMEKQSGFYRVDLATGQSARLFESTHCYECGVMGSGPGLDMLGGAGSLIAYVAEDAMHAPDLWISSADFHHPQQLTHLNPQFDLYAMGSARLIDWTSDDGDRLRGALLLPSGYQQGTKYPLLVYVYPMNLSNEFTHFGFGEYPGPLNLQLFATRGYAVLLPDVPAKPEYGVANIAKAVLTGVTKVVDLGIADPNRIGIMGHSAGGYATLALLVQTNRFKAALDVSGFADYTGMYGHLNKDGTAWSSDEIGVLMGGGPWVAPFRYLSDSPIYYLDRIRTPLFIVHGTEDSAVSSSLSDQVFVGLRQLGREIQYAKYDSETHVPRDWSYANQVDLCQRMLEWFGEHLKPDGIANDRP